MQLLVPAQVFKHSQLNWAKWCEVCLAIHYSPLSSGKRKSARKIPTVCHAYTIFQFLLFFCEADWNWEKPKPVQKDSWNYVCGYQMLCLHAAFPCSPNLCHSSFADVNYQDISTPSTWLLQTCLLIHVFFGFFFFLSIFCFFFFLSFSVFH